MKQSLVCLSALTVAVACSSNGPSSGGGAGAAGAAAVAGASAVAGAGGGGGGAPSGSAGSVSAMAGSSGSVAVGGGGAAGASAIAGAGGAVGGSGGGGTAGTAGSGGAPASTAFKCPTGPFAALDIGAGKAARVPGAPPVDDFNKSHGNVEGPVWIGDSLYFSEMTDGDLPPARILKLAPGGTVSVAVMDSGSNGLAVDAKGMLFAAVHKDGSVSQVALPSGPLTPVVSKYNGMRFTSPNDLAIRSDGTIYFSDPKYQNSANPQGAERLYWVTPGPTRTVTAVTGAPGTPNGVTLSADEKTLYVSGSGLKKFTVNADGSLTNPTDVPGGSGGDGMVLDCSGNLYVATGNNVQIIMAAGGAAKAITVDGGASITNVAFGAMDHKTLYVTAQGNQGQRGVFSIVLNVPGFPY
ncbi:MAG TPA: SMP-30/gluconolactonase/LRE family protein [Polyangiaceae bacterium]